RLDEIAYHEPLELAQSGSLQAAVCSANGRVLAHYEQAFHLAVLHVEPIPRLGMITGNARQPFESKSVFCSCFLAVPGLQQAHDVLVEVAPPSSIAAMTLDVTLQIVSITFPKRHGQISRQNVVKSRNVG